MKMNNNNFSYLTLRQFIDNNFDDENDDNSDNFLGLKHLPETTNIVPVDVDIEPITPPDPLDFNMTTNDAITVSQLA